MVLAACYIETYHVLNDKDALSIKFNVVNWWKLQAYNSEPVLQISVSLLPSQISLLRIIVQ